MTDLPVADPWYVADRMDDRITRIAEPHVHPIFSANLHLVQGAEQDLLIDSGMGVAPLRGFVDGLRADVSKPLICLSTHTHIDHIGAVHEFDIRLVHPLEAETLASPPPKRLRTDGVSEGFRQYFLDAGYDPLWPVLVDAVPCAGYDVDGYVLRGATATGLVEDGDVIDLGDWRAEVLHLPGHSVGQVGLWHAESGTLFGADAVYDGPLLYESRISVPDYATTLRRLRALPVTVVHGGHNDAFGKARLDEICAHYLELWGV